MIVEKKLEALGLTLPDTERDYAVNASGARFVSHLAVATRRGLHVFLSTRNH